MTARDIEVAVANHFDFRRNLVVPNVYWGVGLNHEADLLVLSGAGYASEIEIKISRGDLMKDKKKEHGHRSDIVKALYFAVPEELADFAISNIPDEAGLLVVYRKNNKHFVKVVKNPVPRKHSRKFTEAERYQLARLGLLRYWSCRVPEKGEEAAV